MVHEYEKGTFSDFQGSKATGPDFNENNTMAMWPWYMAICLHGYSAMALYGCIWLCVYTASVWVNLAVCNSMALRLRSYMAVWLYGYTAMAWYGCLWLFGYMAMAWYGCIWLYGYMALRPWHDMAVYGGMAIIPSCHRAMAWYGRLCLYGYMAIWLLHVMGVSGCMAIRLHGYGMIWQYMATWL